MSSRREAKEQRLKQRQSIRDTVHLLLSILSECGVPKLPSECFRQAKFNQQEAVKELWKLLFHIMQIIHSLEGEICVDTVTYHPITPSNMTTVQTMVKHYLYDLGYEREEFYVPFAGSRELLLAFAWLLNRTNFFTRLTKHFVKFANMTTIPLKASNQYLIEQVLEDSRETRHEFEYTIDSLLQAANDHTGPLSISTYTETLHKLAWLKGQLEYKYKAVQRLCMAYHKLSDTIHKSTFASSKKQAGLKAHLSMHEAFLLRFPNQMKTYLAELGHRVSVLHKLLEWRKCEPLFWQWMESVLDLQEGEREREGDEEDTDNQVPKELESVETLSVKVRSLQRDFEESLKRKQSHIDRTEQVWAHKSKMLLYKDINEKLQSVKDQLRYEYPIATMSWDQRALAASMVQQVTAIDGPVYAPVQAVTKQAQRVSLFQVQLQDSSGTMVRTLHRQLDCVSRKIGELEGVIEQRKANIRRILETTEGQFPPSLCKIE